MFVSSQCTHPAYHLFHCYLDLRWLHLILLAVIGDISNVLQSAASPVHSQVFAFDKKKLVNTSTVEHFTTLLVSDLIQLAIMRFEKVRTLHFSDLLKTE